jgi:hypothetical protein
VLIPALAECNAGDGVVDLVKNSLFSKMFNFEISILAAERIRQRTLEHTFTSVARVESSLSAADRTGDGHHQSNTNQ